MLRAVVSPEAPAPAGPYSQAVVAGQFVFLAGQRPAEPRTGAVQPGFTAQVEQALSNVRAVLRSAGTDLPGIVKLTAYLSDLADFGQLNEVFRAWFTEPYPARTTVGARLRGVLVELDVTAVVLGDAAGHSPSHDAMSAPALGADGRSIRTEESHGR